jgi:hypothetical protein
MLTHLWNFNGLFAKSIWNNVHHVYYVQLLKLKHFVFDVVVFLITCSVISRHTALIIKWHIVRICEACHANLTIHNVNHEVNAKIITALSIAEWHKLKLTFGRRWTLVCIVCMCIMCSRSMAQIPKWCGIKVTTFILLQYIWNSRNGSFMIVYFCHYNFGIPTMVCQCMTLFNNRNGSFSFISDWLKFWCSNESVSFMWTSFVNCSVT